MAPSSGIRLFIGFMALGLPCALSSPPTDWASDKPFRVLLSVDGEGSNSPASVRLDFQGWLGKRGDLDKSSIEVIPLGKKERVPHRVGCFFGMTAVTLTFVTDGQAHFAVYFDTVTARSSARGAYPGLIGDGDLFRQQFGRRAVAPSHFDCLVDFDSDGDLDLFKGGVEPFVYCYENVGASRLMDRGKLASGGEPLKLPCSTENRSWMTVTFYDVDGDGDCDFVPSFGDGPDAGRIVLYRNSSEDTALMFERMGVLQTVSGKPLAGGNQAGGWFPSITFVPDWDLDGSGPDALVGSNHRCWLYRKLRSDNEGAPEFADPVAVQAGGADIAVINPRFETADIDADGDLDLFSASQPGPVHWFENTGSRASPVFASGKQIAWTGRYLIGDAHSSVAISDWNGDGRLDLVSGRFWERADLNNVGSPRHFGGYFQNIGHTRAPRFVPKRRGGPFTEDFQKCDVVRQNSVRAADWNGDGRRDLIAGDTDGFVWWFRNRGQGPFALFTAGERLNADDRPLNLAGSGGHARLDVCDWNDDGIRDLVVADGNGTVMVFLGTRNGSLRSGQHLRAGGEPLQVGGRASVLVCDWNNDGAKDLVLADDKGYYVCLNSSSTGAPVLSGPQPILFGGRKAAYARPNLGSFVDWDGDGRKDLIGCHFENSVRFYRNIGSGAIGEEPKFQDPEGIVILRGESPQMISGADVVDWNGDGDPDILTGQGHGGSGLRFYERSWVENVLHGRHPKVAVARWEQRNRR